MTAAFRVFGRVSAARLGVQEFSQWLAEVLHGASSGNRFRAEMAEAWLRRLLKPEAAAAAFGEVYLGEEPRVRAARFPEALKRTA